MESKESSPNEELDTNLEKEKEMVSCKDFLFIGEIFCALCNFMTIDKNEILI